MKEVFVPVLHWFDAKNSFSGSCGDFRFMIKPNVVMATPKEVDFAASSIHAEFWHGPYCYEKSEMEGEETFPLTEQGRQDMIDWLKSKV